MLGTVISVMLQAGVSTPTPAPTLPPEITHTVTSLQCDTLHNVSMPIGMISKTNDKAFTAMAGGVRVFLNSFMPGDAPNTTDYNAAVGNSGAPAGARSNPYGNGTALTTELSAGNSKQDEQVFGPRQRMAAAHINDAAQAIFENVAVERKYLRESYAKVPPGKDPKVDALRTQAEALADLQLAVAQRYETFATKFQSNDENEFIERSDPDLLALELQTRQELFAASGGLAGAPTPKPGNLFSGYRTTGELAAHARNVELLKALRGQEYNFTQSLVSAVNACSSSHYILQP